MSNNPGFSDNSNVTKLSSYLFPTAIFTYRVFPSLSFPMPVLFIVDHPHMWKLERQIFGEAHDYIGQAI